MKVVAGMFIGFVLSVVVSSTLTSMLGETGRSLVVLVNVLIILIGLTQIERAKHWSISYILGYFLGLLTLGRVLMEDWELMIYLLLIGGYLAQKLLRKTGL